MSDEVLRWEAPPERHGNAAPAKPLKYQAAADQLRAKPGEWAVLAEGKTPSSAGGLAARIRRGVGAFAPAGSFEARQIGPASGSVSKVYARYVGGGDGMSSLYDCCPAAPTQPHAADCGLSRSGGDADA